MPLSELGDAGEAPNDTDRSLVERTVRGDRDAFGELVRRHLAAMHAVAYRILRERADADDVCQDAFLAALLHLETFDPSRSFRRWLHEIVKHRALDLRRKQAVRAAETLGSAPGEVDVVAPERDRPDALAERRDLRGRLAGIIATLAEPYRSVLLLHDFEGFRHGEIAATLGCATGTSRHHLFVARRLVALALSANHHTEGLDMQDRTPDPIRRRDFLALSLGLTAAAVLPDVARASAPPAPAPMGRRKLGALEVSSIGLGCMSMAPGFYNHPPPPRAEMVALIRKAVDQGVTFFDTAQVYGPFVSEEIVGEALAPVRRNVVIATKFGFEYPNGQRGPRNSRPEHIRRMTEDSLRRLRTDVIDLYYLHRVDPNVPVEDVAGVVKDLIQQGKVRYFGLSEAAPATIRRAHAVLPVTALQTEYSLVERIPEHGILATCEELGIGFVPWGPVHRGYLSGVFDESTRFAPPDRRASVPTFTPEALRAHAPLLALVRDWARRKGVTPAQLSLGWLLAQKPWIVPIPGTTNPRHLDENLGAAGVAFTAAELAEIRGAVSRVALKGVRAPASATQDQ